MVQVSAHRSGFTPTTARRTRRSWIIGGVALAALAVGAGTAWWLSKPAATRDGSAILGLVLPDADGRQQAVAQWRGKVLVVNFWATWCAPCREEMPQFVKVQSRDEAKGVQFVGIAVDDVAKVRTFAKEIGLNYPTLVGGYGAIELSKALGNELSALPFTVVLGRDGKVALTHLGPLKADKLDEILSRLLASG
jgi:thiol-disulfide isomerase/thioredoxin